MCLCDVHHIPHITLYSDTFPRVILMWQNALGPAVKNESRQRNSKSGMCTYIPHLSQNISLVFLFEGVTKGLQTSVGIVHFNLFRK